jgi:hypothetical protein
MSLLALGAAILGYTTGPSNAAIDLQIALSRTEAATSFTFHIADSSHFHDDNSTSLDGTTGTWEEPYQLQIRSVPGGGYYSSVTFSYGVATDVTRHGNHYTFVVPKLMIHGVAVEPLPSERGAASSPTVAVDTPMEVFVKDGEVVSVSFPKGINGARKHLLDPTMWTLAHFDSAPPVRLPS